MSDLKRNIINHLNKHGFALELESEKILRQTGFEVSPSNHYLDSEENKYREIDLVAFKCITYNDFTFNLCFVFECKNTPERPWVIIKKDREFDDEQLIGAFNHTFNSDIILNSFQRQYEKLQDFDNLIVPTGSNSVGFNVVQISDTNKHNDAYAASMTLKKSCEYLTSKSNQSKSRFANIYIPIIIVNAPLFNCFLSETNELEIKETKYEVMIEVRAFETPFLRSYTIVQRDYLQEYSSKLAVYSDKILDELESAIKQTSKERPISSDDGTYRIV